MAAPRLGRRCVVLITALVALASAPASAEVFVTDDVVPPPVTIDGVQVWDGDATVTFSTPDPDIDDFDCAVDGGEFGWCASPWVARHLTTGSHTVRVRARDELGSVGPITSVTFYVDATAPSVAIGTARLTGSQASMSFRSPDADAQVFECSLDSGAFAACTSPAVFSGLAPGSHVLRVRARDVAGNTGGSDAWGFSVKPPRPPATEEDETAPVIKLLSRRGRVSRRGSFTVKVRCPAGEVRCRLTLRAGAGPKKRATLGSGWTVRVPLKLTAATRRKLATRGRLKVKIQIVARDAAGNRRTKKYPFTVLAPQ
jgi:hypothetical protein